MNTALHSDIELLRFTTAGSVDDGKSTLIGRLLYDSKSIFEDQMEALERSRDITGEGSINLANLTDGLRAEREQGITIDVAYRYFATQKRKFIIADTPGHEQYTRNMVTGASTANLAIVLIDARKGVLVQSRRHAFLASLLQIPHVVVAVNKMDSVQYSQDIFETISREFADFAAKLSFKDLQIIPISALEGDNVVDRSGRMPWYQGPTLLHHLEHVHIAADHNLVDFRFPVQFVIRPDMDFRGFAGQIASGVIRVGDEIVSLPSKRSSRVRRIYTYDGDLEYAFAPQSVTITLEDEIDVSRGCMLVRPGNLPEISQEIEASVCWMHEHPMQVNRKYMLKHASQTVRCMVSRLEYRINVNTLHREQSSHLDLNEIGKIFLRTAKPLFFDDYKVNRETGSFILIDEATNATMASGMIRGPHREARLPLEEVLVEGGGI
ncbi:MAG: sulfate adenylyltransferase subunit CysN [Candidatus Hydrogenedentota bacterium]